MFVQIAQQLTGRGDVKKSRGSFLSPILGKLRVNKA
jgi:pilus assembly protein CpaE